MWKEIQLATTEWDQQIQSTGSEKLNIASSLQGKSGHAWNHRPKKQSKLAGFLLTPVKDKEVGVGKLETEAVDQLGSKEESIAGQHYYWKVDKRMQWSQKQADRSLIALRKTKNGKVFRFYSNAPRLP